MSRRRRSLSRNLSLGILLLGVPFFVLSLGILFYQSRYLIRQETSENFTTTLNEAILRVRSYTNMIETATPLYIDLLLYAMYALVLLAIGFTAWSMVRSMRRQGPDNSRSNRIPARRIGVLILALLAASLGLTYLLSDTRTLIINGKPFDDRFWLRVSDMRPPKAPTGLRAVTDAVEGTITLVWDALKDDDISYYEIVFANDSTHRFMTANNGIVHGAN